MTQLELGKSIGCDSAQETLFFFICFDAPDIANNSDIRSLDTRVDDLYNGTLPFVEIVKA